MFLNHPILKTKRPVYKASKGPDVLDVQTELAEELAEELESILSACTQCGACVKSCSFLQRYGTPYDLADKFKRNSLSSDVAFSCNLCCLCSAVCPEKLDPARLLWLMRCWAVEQGEINFRPYRPLLTYERLGLSSLFEQFFLPENCRSVFFPGCALSGTRPAQFETLVPLLQERVPDLGIVLSCCAKPSHDLGRLAFFRKAFGRLYEKLIQNNIETILTACPSCHQMFSQYGHGLEVKTIYEVLEESWPVDEAEKNSSVTVHDPCNARFDENVQKSVRGLLTKMGFEVCEMKHRGQRTFCCGEGGAVFFVADDLAGSWAKKRWKEPGEHHMVSYCAGCTSFLGKEQPVSHIVDLVFDPKRALAGKAPVSKSPFTYWSRLKLKRKLRKYFT